MMSRAAEALTQTGQYRGRQRRQFTILIDPDLGEWGKQQAGGLSEMVRRLLQQARLLMPAHALDALMAPPDSPDPEQSHALIQVEQSTLDLAAHSCQALSHDLEAMGQTAARAGARSLAESLFELQGRALMTLRHLVDAGAADPSEASEATDGSIPAVP
jgi:hypothetical protein